MDINSDNLIIKSKRYGIVFIIIAEIALTIGYSVWLYVEASLHILAVIFLVFFAIVFVWDYGGWGCTYILDKDGISVHLGFIKKAYKWEDFAIKEIEYDYASYIYSDFYDRTVIFSLRKRKPRWIRPADYAPFHPLSFVYIHFDPIATPKNRDYIYEVNEELFMSKMEEWGVKLEIKRF